MGGQRAQQTGCSCREKPGTMEQGRHPLKLVNVTQWVCRREPINPTRPKASHRVGSRTEVRSSRDGVRSRGEARTQAAELNPKKCIVVVRGQGWATGPKADSCSHWKAAVLPTPSPAGWDTDG